MSLIVWRFRGCGESRGVGVLGVWGYGFVILVNVRI